MTLSISCFIPAAVSFHVVGEFHTVGPWLEITVEKRASSGVRTEIPKENSDWLYLKHMYTSGPIPVPYGTPLNNLWSHVPTPMANGGRAV